MVRPTWIPGILGAMASVGVVILASRIEARAALATLACAAAGIVLLVAWLGERAGARRTERAQSRALAAQRIEKERGAGAPVDPVAARLARRLLGLATAESAASVDAWAWREAATNAARLVSILEPPVGAIETEGPRGAASRT